jgi:chemotaxis signal transduction protein
MTAKAQTNSTAQTQTKRQSGVALRLSLASGQFSIPLHRIHHLAGYATLEGSPEDYFQGWLIFRGERVPVFDLNLVVCDQPTHESFGSRIMILHASPHSPMPYIGLLAGGITDTLSPDPASGKPSAEELNLDSYLPMLYTLIPPAPDDAL